MTQKTSPFLEGKYGWNYGESGWNLGMDEDLLKFSYMFDANIDAIVGSLPSAVTGEAYFLTTDNRVYYSVNSTYYSAPVPKGFTLKLKTTGANYQFDGSSLVPIRSNFELEADTQSLENTFNSQTSDYLNTTDFNKGTSLIGRSLASCASIFDLLSYPRVSTQMVMVAAYHTGAYTLSSPTTVGGGGLFYWSSFTPKASHDGGMVISPTVPWNGSQAGLTAFLSGVGETQPASSGCWVRSTDSVDVRMFGARADRTNVVDDQPSFQAATNYRMKSPIGGVVEIPDGDYLLNGTVLNDRSTNAALGRVSYKGQSQYGTRLTYSGAANNCFRIVNSQSGIGGDGEPNASYQSISDLTIIGPAKRVNSCAILVELGAFFRTSNLLIDAFDYGMYLQDVDQSYGEKLTIRFNLKGILCRKNPVPGVASTQPNNHTYVSCTLGSNSEYGAIFIGGSCINFIGGDVEYNGSSGTGFGLKFQDCGYEGGKGCIIQGAYFEGNTGIADVILEGTTVNVTPLLSIVHQISADFKRTAGSANTTNHILCTFGPASSVGMQKLVTTGSSFKAYGAYTPNTANKSIAYNSTSANIDNYFDCGSLFDVALEKPTFVQNTNMIELRAGKGADQAFTSGSNSQWVIDTVTSPINTLWSPTLSAGKIVIPANGVYTLSVSVLLSTSVSGDKVIFLNKGGSIIATGGSSAQLSTLNCSVTQRFVVGDEITINYIQVTGAAQSILTSGSSVEVVKIF